ncbi:hypothetical protein Cwoe_1964 [Conexibacter woesei DSM 14684]|uniref:Uncharacterized protein n=1 Tax=Conexibacter woesei (strain DSM 14684 / CCUG 47730 / CIP 108061 / JCM 11494 / NBRC 100937 / ID131577) TaxID=469383 RepID=D3F3B0_CONWI|nr:hypothetical protein Cwoe_1964 [Conexibacter woesei DSM 14684]
MLVTQPAHDKAGATLRWVELAESLRSTEVLALHGQALLRGVDPDISTTSSVNLSTRDVADLKEICDKVADRADRLQTLIAQLAAAEFEVKRRDLERDAAAALAAGVADVARVEVLARCLSVKEGFRALAEMLRCTDFHTSWQHTTVGHVLGSFRDADAHFVRRLTAQALLSPEAEFDTCDREQIARLATVLEEHAATARCR